MIDGFLCNQTKTTMAWSIPSFPTKSIPSVDMIGETDPCKTDNHKWQVGFLDFSQCAVRKIWNGARRNPLICQTCSHLPRLLVENPNQ